MPSSKTIFWKAENRFLLGEEKRQAPLQETFFNVNAKRQQQSFPKLFS
jgi:hypothetical protein